MSEAVDPRDASIDGLIDWLRQQRRVDPAAPLADLIAGRKFDRQKLVDVACIDLIERQRMNHQVGVENYLAEFSCLNSTADRLDLIDAELCVARELGLTARLEPYLRRFPDLADEIRELFELEPGVGPMPALIENATVVGGSSESEISMEPDSRSPVGVSVSLPSEARPPQLGSPFDHPVDIPDWFVVAQCVGSGPGRWLIRGRDANRGTALALKITELPTHLTKPQSELILDACEAASRVRNPCWIKPSVAAIQQRHLGVIRPWLFARPWQLCKAAHDHAAQLRELASVAFAIESAHQNGATHGGLHADNLMVDHGGSVRVLDAASSRIGLQRWLNPSDDEANGEQIASFDERVQLDVRDLVKLVDAATVDSQRRWTIDLIVDLRRIANTDQQQACGQIGRQLIRCADELALTANIDASPVGGRRPWRQRLAQWINGNLKDFRGPD